MNYKINKTEEINPKIDSKEWEKAEIGRVDSRLWTNYEQSPNMTFRILKGPLGISVLMSTDERNLKAQCDEENGMVCRDSCMEFFIKPDTRDVNYMNFEFNPKGVLHLGIGQGPADRTLIWEDRATFKIESDAKEGDWRLKFYIPFDFLDKYYKNLSEVFKGNFFKCANKDDTSHYATWSPVRTKGPDFHQPDFFGFFEI